MGHTSCSRARERVPCASAQPVRLGRRLLSPRACSAGVARQNHFSLIFGRVCRCPANAGGDRARPMRRRAKSHHIVHRDAPVGSVPLRYHVRRIDAVTFLARFSLARRIPWLEAVPAAWLRDWHVVSFTGCGGNDSRARVRDRPTNRRACVAGAASETRHVRSPPLADGGHTARMPAARSRCVKRAGSNVLGIGSHPTSDGRAQCWPSRFEPYEPF